MTSDSGQNGKADEKGDNKAMPVANSAQRTSRPCPRIAQFVYAGMFAVVGIVLLHELVGETRTLVQDKRFGYPTECICGDGQFDQLKKQSENRAQWLQVNKPPPAATAAQLSSTKGCQAAYKSVVDFMPVVREFGDLRLELQQTMQQTATHAALKCSTNWYLPMPGFPSWTPSAVFVCVRALMLAVFGVAVLIDLNKNIPLQHLLSGAVLATGSVVVISYYYPTWHQAMYYCGLLIVFGYLLIGMWPRQNDDDVLRNGDLNVFSWPHLWEISRDPHMFLWAALSRLMTCELLIDFLATQTKEHALEWSLVITFMICVCVFILLHFVIPVFRSMSRVVVVEHRHVE